MWRLYIKNNNELLEINGLNDQGFMFENNNPLDWSFGKANKTFSINIPNIAGNNLALGNLWDKGRELDLNFNAVLSVDTLQMNGRLQIFEFNKKSARAQFISSNLANFKTITDKNLKDLDWSELLHTLTPQNVTTSFSQNLLNGTIVYDWLDRGTGHYWDSLARDDDWGKVIGLNETQGAIRVKSIIEKIFTGYALDWQLGSSTYMQFINDLYMLHTGEQTRNTPGWAERFTTEAGRDDHFETHTVQREMSDLSVIGPPPDFEDGPPNPGSPIIVYVGDYNIINAGVQSFIDSVGPTGEQIYSIRRFNVQEGGTYRFRFDSKFNLKIASTVSSVPRTIQWLDTQLFFRVERRESSTSAWTNHLTKQIASFSGVQHSGSQIEYLWDDWGEVLPLDTTFIQANAGVQWRAYTYFQIIPRPIVGTNGTQTYNFKIDIDYLAGEVNPSIPKYQNSNRINIDTWNAPGLNSTVPGNWWVPNINTGEFLKAFLLLVNGELFINDELQKATIRNRFTETPEFYDITDRVIEGSEEFTPFNRDWNLEYQWTVDGNDLWAQSIHPTESPYLKRIETGSNDERVVKHPYSYTESVVKAGKSYLRLWNDLEEPRFSLDFTPRYMLYGGTDSHSSIIKTLQSSTSIDYPTLIIPRFSTISGISLKWTDPSAFTLYDAFHSENTQRIVEGGILQIEILLDTNWLNQLYYIEGKSMEANFRIKIPGYWGYYQIIKLTHKTENVWRATCIRLPDERIDGIISGDFNNDFNNDF